jgi:hypothetical protein
VSTEPQSQASVGPAPYKHDEEGRPVFGHLGPLKPDLWLPGLLKGEVVLEQEPGVLYQLELGVLDVHEGYRLISFTVETSDGLTTSQLHKISLPKILHALASADPFVVSATMPGTPEREDRVAASNDESRKAWVERVAVEAQTSGPTSDVLHWAARVYAWYKAVGGNPALAVQETLDIPARTATRWIAKARAEGMLN